MATLPDNAQRTSTIADFAGANCYTSVGPESIYRRCLAEPGGPRVLGESYSTEPIIHVYRPRGQPGTIHRVRCRSPQRILLVDRAWRSRVGFLVRAGSGPGKNSSEDQHGGKAQVRPRASLAERLLAPRPQPAHPGIAPSVSGAGLLGNQVFRHQIQEFGSFKKPV